MEVQFALDEADLIALAKFRVKHSPAIRRRYRMSWIGVPIGFGLAALFLYVVFSLESPALYLVAFGLFFLVFYPYYYRWLVGRTMRRIVSARSNPKAFERRTIRVTAEGLEMTGAGTKFKKSWNHVNRMEVTPGHAFLAIDGDFAVVLPRSGLGDEGFQQIITSIQKFARL